MYSVWFCDLKKAIEVLEQKCPNLKTFESIEGNAFGDFIIRSNNCTYLVKHTDFSIWYFEGDWKIGQWTKIEG